MESKLLLEHFTGMVSSADDVPKLNGAILQLAVRGKLTAQEATDEPASDLLKRITAERVRLIAEKKIRKGKPLPAIGEEERPFALPDGWEWVRLGDLCTITGGKRIPKGYSLQDEPTPHVYIRVTDMKNGTIINSKLKYISTEVHEMIRKYIIEETDLYITIAGTIGQVGDVPEKYTGMNLTENAARITPFKVDNSWLKDILNSIFVQSQFQNKVNQMAQPKLALIRIKTTLIPLPPLAEQRRIVERVDTLLAQTSQLKAALAEAEEALMGLHGAAVEGILTAVTPQQFADKWQFIANNFDTFYDEAYPKAALANVAALKQTILQLAVQGKLTRQDPADEPASALLERIAAEKARLIAEKKIRKGKVLPEIGDEERPFVLPDGWEWVRFGDLIELVSGQHIKQADYDESGNGMPYLTGPSDFGRIHPKITKWTIKPKSSALDADILLTVKGSGLGKLNVVSGQEVAIGRQLMAIRPMLISSEYIFLYLDSLYEHFQANGIGIAIPGIGRGFVNNLIFLLPPLAEQKRIVARVNSLLAHCDDLTTHLRAAQAAQAALRDVVVG